MPQKEFGEYSFFPPFSVKYKLEPGPGGKCYTANAPEEGLVGLQNHQCTLLRMVFL